MHKLLYIWYIAKINFMKNLLIFILILSIFASCKDSKKEEEIVINDTVEVNQFQKTPDYPKSLAKVFEAHGGIAQWNKMQNLCYEMDAKDGTEVHTISLPNRLTKIETKDWSIGYNGTEVWLLQNKPDTYKGNARFYHNLMFYFYAMPFVLGDNGIIYTEMDATELDGKTYNAIKISYKAGIGDSPEDEYILFYDPETNTMEWLGYTVTYSENEKSDDWHYIKYDKWQDVNGMLLPKKLTWYNVKDGKPTDERSDKKFDKVTITETVLETSVFKKPEGAVIVEK
jgi:hypothetical protein